MFHLVSFWWIRRTPNISSFGRFYKNWEFYLEVILVGYKVVTLRYFF